MDPNSLNAEHRISCHRCGNIRKRRMHCINPNCPHTFCGRCTDKLKIEYGPNVFANGCPVCQEMCCCTKKSVHCNRQFHCYRKCPATKATTKPYCQVISSKGSDSEKEIKHSDSLESSDNEASTPRKLGIGDLLLASADIDNDSDQPNLTKKRKLLYEQQVPPPLISLPQSSPIPIYNPDYLTAAMKYHQQQILFRPNDGKDTVAYVPVLANTAYMAYPYISIPIAPPVTQDVEPESPASSDTSSHESGIHLLASISSYNYLVEQTKSN
jgi:hypothetical protein